MKVKVHRGTKQIGGDCIELSSQGVRILLDVGLSQIRKKSNPNENLVPQSLNFEAPVDAVIITHPHHDHFGLLDKIPESVPVWIGKPSELLVKQARIFFEDKSKYLFKNYRNRKKFEVGPFVITPFISDHLAFDSHMMLIECDNQRVFYTGELRKNNSNLLLNDKFLEMLPKNIDVLLMDWSFLRNNKLAVKIDLEEEYAKVFLKTKGKVFCSWAAHDIDLSAALYQACLEAGRSLVIDVFSADTFMSVCKVAKIPNPSSEYPRLKVVVTNTLKVTYARAGRSDFINQKCIPYGLVAKQLNENKEKWVVSLSPQLLRDYKLARIGPNRDDSWVFSHRRGMLDSDYRPLRAWFRQGDTPLYYVYTNRHFSLQEMKQLAVVVDPKILIPVHRLKDDKHLNEFNSVLELKDAEEYTIP